MHQCLCMGWPFAADTEGVLTLSTGLRLDFLRRQVLTSRNIRGERWGWTSPSAG